MGISKDHTGKRSASALRSAALHLLAQVTRRVQPPGIKRLVRYLCDPDGPKNTHFQSVICYEGKFLIHADTSSFLEWSVFFFGHYELEVVRLIRRYLPSGGVAVDVGANVGLMTLAMVKAAGSGGRVIAVEPDPNVYERLSQNLRLNGLEGVLLYRCALGATPGQGTLHCPAPGAVNSGCATFASKTQASLSVDLEVPIRTLDQLVEQERLSRLDLLKIDTEGWDFFVLKGGEKSIGAFRPVILFEYMESGWSQARVSLKEATDWLLLFRYRLFVIQEKGLIPFNSVPSACFNILALPEARP